MKIVNQKRDKNGYFKCMVSGCKELVGNFKLLLQNNYQYVAINLCDKHYRELKGKKLNIDSEIFKSEPRKKDFREFYQGGIATHKVKTLKKKPEYFNLKKLMSPNNSTEKKKILNIVNSKYGIEGIKYVDIENYKHISQTLIDILNKFTKDELIDIIQEKVRKEIK